MYLSWTSVKYGNRNSIISLILLIGSLLCSRENLLCPYLQTKTQYYICLAFKCNLFLFNLLCIFELLRELRGILGHLTQMLKFVDVYNVFPEKLILRKTRREILCLEISSLLCYSISQCHVLFLFLSWEGLVRPL